MKYELFGTNHSGLVEFLGTYADQGLLLEAVDQYEGLGYKKIKYCKV